MEELSKIIDFILVNYAPESNYQEFSVNLIWNTLNDLRDYLLPISMFKLSVSTNKSGTGLLAAFSINEHLKNVVCISSWEPSTDIKNAFKEFIFGISTSIEEYIKEDL